MTDGSLRVADDFKLSDVRRAERAAILAWPAAETVDLDGWQARRTLDTSSRRANSAIASGRIRETGVGAAIRAVEQYYANNGGTPRFQMSPTSQPAALDDTLASCGYRIEAPVKVMTARPSDVPRSDDWTVRLDERPDAAWRDAFHEAVPLPGEADGRIAMVERARGNGLGVVYASIRNDIGGVTSLGVGVFGNDAPGGDGGDWALVFSMNTLMSHRRRGQGSAVLAGLMAHALEIGGETAYLQVETNNPGAIAAYRRLGFRDLFSYHYRSLARIPKVG